MRFLLCSLSGLGFISSTIGLGLSLTRKGHEVRVVTDLSCEKQLSRQDLERIPRGLHDGPSFQTHIWGQPASIAIQVKHLEFAIELFRPDVLVGQQLTWGALITAERQRMPLALLGFSTYLWPRKKNPEARGDDSLKEWRYTNDILTLSQLRPGFGLSRSASELPVSSLLGNLFMVRSIPELEGDISNLPEQIHLVGPCIWESNDHDPELDDWLSDSVQRNAPLIYVQQGRFFDRPHFWPKVVEAFGNTEIRVIACTGSMDCPVGEVPPNFLVRKQLPQGKIMRHTTAMIASANTTAVLGALLAGVPSILIPAGGEQPDVAERCFHAGVARVLNPVDVTPERLRSELLQLADDSAMKCQVSRLAIRFSQANTFDTATSLLEDLATNSFAERLESSCYSGSSL
jgi:MGT family glycosyltransferase